MGILDRFRKTADQPKPSTRSRGGSGRAHIRGFLEFEDVGRDFVHPRSHVIYDRMYRTDPDVRRSLDLVINPIRGGSWRVEPFGGDEAKDVDEEVAEFTEWWLWEFMRPSLPDHLAEALPVVARSGFAPFEAVWGKGEWRGREVLVPRKLSLRLPRSVQEFHQDKDGDLEKITQFLTTHASGGDGFPSGLVDIPAKDLVYYRTGAEGDNWEGVSLLRAAYKPWYLKDSIERMEAVACEREAVGIPILYPPSDADPEMLEDWEDHLEKIGSGDRRYLIMPGPHADDAPEGQQGWRLEIEGLGAGTGTRDFQKSIQGFIEAIARALIADFMELGKGGEGARATADVQQNPFYQGVEALAGVVERPLNDSLIARAADLNFPNLEGPPKLTMEEADATTLAELATAVSSLVTAGVLQVDPELEDHIREVAGLPPANPEVREQREREAEEQRQLELKQGEAEVEARKKGLEAPVPGKPGDPKQPGAKPAPGKARPKERQTTKEKTVERFDEGGGSPLGGSEIFGRQDRALRPFEEHMSLDTLESVIDRAREDFEAAAGAEARAVAWAMVVNNHADPEPLIAALEAELSRLYEVGRRTVAEEADRQRGREPGTYSHTFAAEEQSRLRRRAQAAARGILGRIASAIERLALLGRASQADLLEAAEREARASLHAEALVHAVPALNEGRADGIDALGDRVRGVRYTSILDKNRCEACAEADDDELRALDDPIRLARKPPNPECHGGSRCRCMEFAELVEEDRAAAEGPLPT